MTSRDSMILAFPPGPATSGRGPCDIDRGLPIHGLPNLLSRDKEILNKVLSIRIHRTPNSRCSLFDCSGSLDRTPNSSPRANSSNTEQSEQKFWKIPKRAKSPSDSVRTPTVRTLVDPAIDIIRSVSAGCRTHHKCRKYGISLTYGSSWCSVISFELWNVLVPTHKLTVNKLTTTSHVEWVF